MAAQPSIPPGSAPNKLLPLLADQPIGEVRGSYVYPTMPLAQMLQRILSYLGQPGSATGGKPTGETLTQGVQSAAELAGFAAYGVPAEAAFSVPQPPRIDPFPPNSPDGGGSGSTVGVEALQQGTQYTQGVVVIGPLLVLNGQTLDGEIWAPMTNGDVPEPGGILIGYPDGQSQTATLLTDPVGMVVMARVT